MERENAIRACSMYAGCVWTIWNINRILLTTTWDKKSLFGTDTQAHKYTHTYTVSCTRLQRTHMYDAAHMFITRAVVFFQFFFWKKTESFWFKRNVLIFFLVLQPRFIRKENAHTIFTNHTNDAAILWWWTIMGLEWIGQFAFFHYKYHLDFFKHFFTQ